MKENKDLEDKGYLGNEENISSVEVLFADGTHGYRTAKKIAETARYIDVQGVLDSIK